MMLVFNLVMRTSIFHIFISQNTFETPDIFLHLPHKNPSDWDGMFASQSIHIVYAHLKVESLLLGSLLHIQSPSNMYDIASAEHGTQNQPCPMYKISVPLVLRQSPCEEHLQTESFALGRSFFSPASQYPQDRLFAIAKSFLPNEA